MVRPLARRPLIVKLSPNVARIEPLAQAAEQAGADAISLVNTFVSLAIDAHTRRPRIGAGFGGLSGPAIKPIALRLVYEASQAVRIPVIGLGGIRSGEDAAEFLVAGAAAVQVGTANFWDPEAPCRIARELDDYLETRKHRQRSRTGRDFADMKQTISTDKAPKAHRPLFASRGVWGPGLLERADRRSILPATK